MIYKKKYYFVLTKWKIFYRKYNTVRISKYYENIVVKKHDENFKIIISIYI